MKLYLKNNIINKSITDFTTDDIDIYCCSGGGYGDFFLTCVHKGLLYFLENDLTCKNILFYIWIFDYGIVDLFKNYNHNIYVCIETFSECEYNSQLMINLNEKFKSVGNKERPNRYVSVQMEDRLKGLLKKETEIIEKEFNSSIKNKRGVDSKKSVRIVTSLENFYKNADSIIKNSKIIIVSDLETRKLFRKKSSPGGVNRDTFIARLLKVGERNSITIKSYLLLYKYDVDKVLNESSFSDLVSNTREQYVKSSEFGAGFKTQVDKGDKSSFIDYELGDALASAPAGVSEFRGVADVLQKEDEADEETTINEIIQIQKKS